MCGILAELVQIYSTRKVINSSGEEVEGTEREWGRAIENNESSV